MAINLIGPQALSAATLIADSFNSVNGAIGSTAQMTMVNGQPVCAALEIRSTLGTLLIPRLTASQITALPTSGPLVDGMMVFNSTSLAFQLRINGAWVNFSAGAGTGTGVLNYRTVTSTPFTAFTTDCIIGVNFAGAVAISLPAATGVTAGKTYKIQDESGAANVNNITISSLGGTINGGANVVINAAYGSRSFYSNGTNWFASTATGGP